MKLLAEKLWIKGDTFELIPGILRLTYAENDGAAFSMLSGRREFFIVVTIIVLVAAFYFLLRGHIHGLFGIVSLSLCISGAIGNFIDRVSRGYVVDMFEPIFIDFAIFNVADILLNVGGIAFALYFLFFHERNRERDDSPIDIRTADYKYISVSGTELTELDLRDGKLGFRIKQYRETKNGESDFV